METTRVRATADLRRHERFAFSGPLRVRILGELSWVAVEACDVSESGLSFISPSHIERGQQIRVLGPDHSFLIDACVMHASPRDGGYIVGAERQTLA